LVRADDRGATLPGHKVSAEPRTGTSSVRAIRLVLARTSHTENPRLWRSKAAGNNPLPPPKDGHYCAPCVAEPPQRRGISTRPPRVYARLPKVGPHCPWTRRNHLGYLAQGRGRGTVESADFPSPPVRGLFKWPDCVA
jgi:hypothetical protein